MAKQNEVVVNLTKRQFEMLYEDIRGHTWTCDHDGDNRRWLQILGRLNKARARKKRKKSTK